MPLRASLFALAFAFVMSGCDRAELAEAAPADPAVPAEAVSPTAPPSEVAATPEGGEPLEDAALDAALGEPASDTVDPAPAEAAVEAPPRVYAATLRGSCEHYVDCKCEAFTVSECVDTLTEQTGGATLPSSLYSCLNGLSCDDLCSDTSPGVTRCTEAATAAVIAQTEAAARAQAASHRATMGVIGNMGTTCPSGQRLVNGSCVSY